VLNLSIPGGGTPTTEAEHISGVAFAESGMQGADNGEITPAQLNATPDTALRAHVDAVVHGAGRPVKLARFITLDVLVRVHNMVVAAVGSDGTVLATRCRVVQSMTGRPLEPDDRDAQHHGQRMSWYIFDHPTKVAALEKTAKQRKKRLLKRGQPTNGWDREVKEQQEKLYVCPYGATPLTFAQPTNHETPWRLDDAADAARDLHQQLLSTCAAEATEAHELTRAVETAKTAMARADRRQALCKRIEDACKRRVELLQANLDDAIAKKQRCRELKAAMACAKRKAIDRSEALAVTNKKRKTKLETARGALADEVAAHEETKLQLETLQQRCGAVLSAESPFSFSSRNKETGRREPYPWQGRVAIMAQLARLTPVRAVPRNLADSHALFAPGTPFREPHSSLVYEVREELPLLGESLAAYQVGMAARVMSFGWDASTKLHVEGLSSNTQIETADGQVRPPFLLKYLPLTTYY